MITYNLVGLHQQKHTSMNKLTTLFPIAGLLIIAIWFFYETKVYSYFIKSLNKYLLYITGLLCIVCEQISDNIEVIKK